MKKLVARHAWMNHRVPLTVEEAVEDFLDTTNWDSREDKQNADIKANRDFLARLTSFLHERDVLTDADILLLLPLEMWSDDAQPA